MAEFLVYPSLGELLLMTFQPSWGAVQATPGSSLPCFALIVKLGSVRMTFFIFYALLPSGNFGSRVLIRFLWVTVLVLLS